MSVSVTEMEISVSEQEKNQTKNLKELKDMYSIQILSIAGQKFWPGKDFSL